MTVILDEKTTIDVVNKLRDRKRKTVLTHGVFDLLHIGHINFLSESKKKGDYLIVGVDSDWMVNKYKDIKRPVIPHEQRMKLIRELKSVDFVFPLHDEEKLGQDYFVKLYEQMTPNMVAFGKVFGFKTQYSTKKFNISGIKYSKITHEYENIQSTTGIIENIKRS